MGEEIKPETAVSRLADIVSALRLEIEGRISEVVKLRRENAILNLKVAYYKEALNKCADERARLLNTNRNLRSRRKESKAHGDT